MHPFLFNKHTKFSNSIDIIDETGSEVRTRNRDLPRGLEKLLIELQATLDDGQKAIENHDFALAKLMYEHELEVRGHIRVVKSALKNKKIDGLVTSPIHKKNIQSPNFNFSGHTPYLQHAFGNTENLMLLVAEAKPRILS